MKIINKYINKISFIIIALSIIAFSILIGANEKGLRIIPISIFLLLELLYLIIRKFKYKENIVIKNKIDLLFLLFFISTCLPFIFHTYSSLNGVVDFIYKYLFVYTTYLCVRNSKLDNYKNNILYVIFFGSFIICLFAIDMMHFNWFKSIYDYFNLYYKDIKYLSGTFGYKNTYAIYFLCCFYIAFYLLKNNTNKKKRIFLLAYMIFALVNIIFSFSRFVIILTILSILIYLFILNYKKIKKYIKKVLIISVSAILFLIVIYAFVSKKTEIINIKDKKAYILNHKFKSNKKYTLSFYTEKSETFDLEIEETDYDFNKYNYNYHIVTKKIEDNLYRYDVDFTTLNKPVRVKLFLSSKEKVLLSEFKINDTEYTLKSKYIPYIVSYGLSNISIYDNSIYQRKIFYKDALKIFKESPLIGRGGNAWKTESLTVQDFKYSVKETHSYFFELLISFGIVGLSLFTILFIYLNVIFIKNTKKNKNNLSLLFGLDLIIIHSYFFDFNMSFLIILLIVYTLSGLIVNEMKLKETKRNNLVDYISIVLLIIFTSILFIELLYRNNDYSLFNREYRRAYISNLLESDESSDSKINEIKKYIKTEPYYYQAFMENNLYMLLTKNKLSEEELIYHMKFINKNNHGSIYRYKFNYNSRLKRISLSQAFHHYLVNLKLDNEELNKQISIYKESIIEECKNTVKLIENDKTLNPEEKNLLIKNYNEIIKNLK